MNHWLTDIIRCSLRLEVVGIYFKFESSNIQSFVYDNLMEQLININVYLYTNISNM